MPRQTAVIFYDSDDDKDSFASPLHKGHSLQAFCAQDLSIILQKLGQGSVVIAFWVGGFVGSAVVSDAVGVRWLNILHRDQKRTSIWTTD